jgi:hypothetical protein
MRQSKFHRDIPNETPITRSTKTPNIKEYHIGVWDCRFYLIDDDNNAVLNKDGEVQLYDAPELDLSHISDYVEHDDLKEV